MRRNLEGDTDKADQIRVQNHRLGVTAPDPKQMTRLTKADHHVKSGYNALRRSIAIKATSNTQIRFCEFFRLRVKERNHLSTLVDLATKHL